MRFRVQVLTWLAPALCCAAILTAGSARAVSFTEFVDPHPAVGNKFGAVVVPLSTGNVVITSPFDDAGGTDAGAVYLFNGATGALISTLLGSTADDQVGSGGVTALTNGNFVVLSPNWDNGGIVDAGAVTWESGAVGVNGAISASNSLVGSTEADQVGYWVTALTNGNYVVLSPHWNNGLTGFSAGAATWGSGTAGVSGVVSTSNSLVGSTEDDQIGNWVTALTNGNYVVSSPYWDNGLAAYDAGAATWGNGTTGVTGEVSGANSLLGSSPNDHVGSGIAALSNGNYVVDSENWHTNASVGAVTWANGTTGMIGLVSAANSLVGSNAGDLVGYTAALPNGNYVVESPYWANGYMQPGAGAVTWGNGTSGVTGVISASNSLVGSKSGSGPSYVAVLSNGNYVIGSPYWDNGAVANVGAATWANGTTGITGQITTSNSLVGSAIGDEVGADVTALANGNYVVRSSYWGTTKGAATWGNGTTGTTGVVTAANSLVGSSIGDYVGHFGVFGLSSGNYVVLSPYWSNGAITGAGAATWGDGTAGTAGAVSSANSLVGSTVNDNVGSSVTVLSNGNYVVGSSYWSNGSISRAGAATWADGTAGATGMVSTANSLVGSTANDYVGAGGTALSNGNYVVTSPRWHNGALANAGAATWGNGTTGMTGVVSSDNSLVGLAANSGLVNALEDKVNGTFISAFPMEGGGHVRVGPLDLSTPTLIALVNATATATNVQLTWYAADALGIVATVYRRTVTSDWGALGQISGSGTGQLVWDDAHVSAGERYGYRLGLMEQGQETFVGETWVDVPLATEFALEGARPNPASGHDLRVAFALPIAAPAQLELLDVTGRRIFARDVGALGPGQHSVNLAEGHSVATGIYWVRLTQGANRRTTRAAVIE